MMLLFKSDAGGLKNSNKESDKHVWKKISKYLFAHDMIR